MRNLMNIVDDRLDQCFEEIGNYIEHNTDIDFRACAETLKEFGYEEPINQTTFYRVLFHDTTPEDKSISSNNELFAKLQAEIRFDLSKGPQGFAATRKAITHFVYGTLHRSWERKDWPNIDPDGAVGNEMIVIYTVESPSSAILFSTRGLSNMLARFAPRGQKPTGSPPGHRRLDVAINDLWSGSSSEDEVVIDASKCRITNMEMVNPAAIDDD